MDIRLPEKVAFILGTLSRAGYEAYAVGGCVRDTMLDRTPGDWDITTSALPLETKALFARTVDTGIKHGTVTVMLGHEGFEVTTYRVDGAYTDSRHPDSVSFTRCLSEDLRRRDFTINAMAYNETDGLQDLFGGTGDLEAGIIRCVGNPSERFGEDALRILRAVRFGAQLGFTIEEETARAAAAAAPSLVHISAERIHAELDKLLRSPHSERMRDLHALGLDTYIFPELEALCRTSPERADLLFRLLASSPCELRLRWALVLLFTGSGDRVMRRLKFDNATRLTVNMLTEHVMEADSSLSDAGLRRLMNRVGASSLPLLIAFRASLDEAYGPFDDAALLARCHAVLEAGQATDIKGLAIGGHDLLEAGIPAGSGIGTILTYLMDRVLEDPSLNTRETLLELAAGQKTV